MATMGILCSLIWEKVDPDQCVLLLEGSLSVHIAPTIVCAYIHARTRISFNPSYATF